MPRGISTPRTQNMEQILLGACKHLDCDLELGRRHRCCFQPLTHFWYSAMPPSGSWVRSFLKPGQSAKPERAGCCKHREPMAGLSGLQRGIDACRGCNCSPGRLSWAHSTTDQGAHHCRGFLLPLWRLGRPRSRPWQTVSGEACLPAHGHWERGERPPGSKALLS